MSWTIKIAGLLSTVGALWCFSATEALAQKGMGELSGVARQAVKPEVVSLTGKVTAVESGPCELTTGRASIGTHVMLETEDGESLNVHLGPQVAVAELAKRLKRGTALSVRAFRTDKMPEGHYVAQSLTLRNKTIELRDASLRPVWAGGRGAGRRGWQAGPAAGFGRGIGPGFGAGQGAGRAAAPGQRQGRQGFGPGQGMGPAGWNCPRWGGPPQWNCPRWGGPPQGVGPGRRPAQQGRGPAWNARPQGPPRGAAQGFGRGGGRGRGAGFGQQQRQGRGAAFGRGPAW